MFLCVLAKHAWSHFCGSRSSSFKVLSPSLLSILVTRIRFLIGLDGVLAEAFLFLHIYIFASMNRIVPLTTENSCDSAA